MTTNLTRISQRCDGRDNNFNLLRFAAATSVILSHSIVLSGDLDNAMAWRLGYVAVNCFFIISGFLVCQSLLARRNLLHYGISRALRVYPALVVCVFLCVVVVGLWQTSLPPGEYISHPRTGRFWLNNSLLFTGEVYPYLPMVFSRNPVVGQVNAPLWTLQYELFVYAILALLFALAKSGGRSGRDRRFTLFLCLFGAIAMSLYLLNVASDRPQTGVSANLARCGAMFASGAIIFVFRHSIPLSGRIFVVLLCLVAASQPYRPLFVCVTYLSLGYLLIYLALVPAGVVRCFNLVGDYSYGLYIYGFPVQQLYVAYFPQISPTGLFACSMVTVLPLAIVSWHLLEKPLLSRKPASQGSPKVALTPPLR